MTGPGIRKFLGVVQGTIDDLESYWIVRTEVLEPRVVRPETITQAPELKRIAVDLPHRPSIDRPYASVVPRVPTMDLDLDDPGALEALQRCLHAIADIEECASSLPADPSELGQPGSDIAALIGVLPDPPVDIRHTLLAAVDSSQSCLGQIRRFIVDQIPTSPIVLATLCRTALVASSRLLLIVGPSDGEVQKTNATRILLQESESIQRCYKKALNFTHLVGLVPSQDLINQQNRRHQHLKRVSKNIRESEVLDEIAPIIGALLQHAGQYEPTDEGQLREHLHWVFNTYSGIAHGFGWPKLVPGSQSLPGHFVSDLWLTASVSLLAIDRLRTASR